MNWVVSSLVPRPHPKNREMGLVLLANLPMCAESVRYATITCLTVDESR